MHAAGRIPLLFVLCTIAIVRPAAPAAAAPAATGPQSLRIATDDGGSIEADLYPGGPHAVVLAHGAVFDKGSWGPLLGPLRAAGLTVLAINFRGYGASRAGSDPRGLWRDVLAAVRDLHDRGYATVSVIGGSMGGGAAARAVVESRPGEIESTVLLSPVPIARPERLKGRLLFVVSREEGLYGRVLEQYRRAPEPRQLLELPGDAHAQHVFRTPQLGPLVQAVVAFLKAAPRETAGGGAGNGG